MFKETEDKTRLIRQMSQVAINLAIRGRWEEAVSVNQTIIENVPTDIDAYNRLGKAYMELNELDKAREAYSKVLELDPYNSIASKNLNRLSQLKATKLDIKKERVKVPPHQFIGEAVKSGVVSLSNLTNPEILAKMTAGDKVNLKTRGQQLIVENVAGEYLGQVEPQHGPRLAKLMDGGNKYSAAIVSVDVNKVKVIIKETFQHPDLIGHPSFPAKPVEGFQPHVKDTLLRRRTPEEEELMMEVEEAEYLEEEAPELLPEGFSILEEGGAPLEGELTDEIEEE